MSMALLNASARALANFPSLESHIVRLFELISSQTPAPSALVPITFIRIDLAHLMKNVADSDAFQDVRPKVKQLINETDFVNAERHIRNVLIVALSNTGNEDNNINFSKNVYGKYF